MAYHHYVLQNQLQQIREVVDGDWTIFDHPETGEPAKYITQKVLIEMLDEFGVEPDDLAGEAGTNP